MSEFSKRLLQIMKEKNLSQSDLAKLTDITPSSISDWLKDKYQPKQDKIFILADKLKVEPSWLLGVDDEPQHNFDTFQYKGGRVAALFDKTRDLSDEDLKQITDYIDLIRKSKGLD